MNKEFNEKVNELLADFEKRQEEICNEISNLEKSTNAIKDSILKEWEIVEKSIIEEIEYATKIIYNITKCNNNYYYSEHSQYRKEFFVFHSCNYEYTNSVVIYSSEIGFSKISFKLDDWYYVKPNNNKLELFNNNDFFKTFEPIYKEFIIKIYKSGKFTEQVIQCIQSAINSTLNEYNVTLESNKRILENVQPITKNDTHWSDYIMYLLKWSSEHADKEFAGMSPACYDEWLDNEQGE